MNHKWTKPLWPNPPKFRLHPPNPFSSKQINLLQHTTRRKNLEKSCLFLNNLPGFTPHSIRVLLNSRKEKRLWSNKTDWKPEQSSKSRIKVGSSKESGRCRRSDNWELGKLQKDWRHDCGSLCENIPYFTLWNRLRPYKITMLMGAFEKCFWYILACT